MIRITIEECSPIPDWKLDWDRRQAAIGHHTYHPVLDDYEYLEAMRDHREYQNRPEDKEVTFT